MKTKSWTLIIACSILAVALAVLAAELRVEDGVICRDVVDRAPQEPGTVFRPDVGKLFCFTRIVGAESETTVTHIWYLGERELASVPLKVASASYRTWSSKIIDPDWRGEMKVEIRDAEGKVLATLRFKLAVPEEEAQTPEDTEEPAPDEEELPPEPEPEYEPEPEPEYAPE